MRRIDKRRTLNEIFYFWGAVLIFSAAMMTVMYYAMR